MTNIEMARNDHEWEIARVMEQYIELESALYDDPQSDYLKSRLDITKKQLEKLGVVLGDHDKGK